MQYQIYTKDGFEYIRQGEGPDLLLLHGLFGALSNWYPVVDYFANYFTVHIPILPVYRDSHVVPSLDGLRKYLEDYMAISGLREVSLVGNSLGGHLALLLALHNPKTVKTVTLTGSSGLFEEGMGKSYPKRGNYEYVKERVEFTFFNPKTATKELVDEVYHIINDAGKAIRVIKVARNAQRLNMREEIRSMKQPTCLIWGLNDNITPPYVAHEFNRLVPEAELHFVDHCGHAAMMEQPERFNALLFNFLGKYYPINYAS